MKTADAIAWFKRQFGERVAAVVEGTPFSVDLVAAIAQQETGYIWSGLVRRGLAEGEVLRLCVGDTLDEDRGRSSFPRNKRELLRAPRGAEMFAIARQALLDMARFVNGYQAATINPNKFCHGFGIFQYDLQFFETNPDYFLEKRWGDFDACLRQFLAELKEAKRRQGWGSKTALTDDERIYVAIAYNKGRADCARGFRQGHRCDGRYYGENIFEFLRLARSIPLEGAPAVPLPEPLPEAAPEPAHFTGRAPVYEVITREGPLRLRREPEISAPNPGANVIARLPRGQLVQLVSRRKRGEFFEVETLFEGENVRGFAASKFLRRVKRARPADSSGLGSAKSVEDREKKKGKGSALAAPPAVDDPAIDMNIDAIIRAVQKELGIGVDGKAGPETWKAIYFKITGKKVPGGSAPASTAGLPVTATGQVDARSEKTIATLQPEVRPYARALVKKAAALGITIKVISGLRTYAEQNALYAQGRTKPGRIVTNAKGGYSNHNFGVAFDVGVFRGSSYIPESPAYKAVGALGVELGLEWGGNWKTIKDEPHFQLRPNWAVGMPEKEMLAQLRTRKDQGRGFFS